MTRSYVETFFRHKYLLAIPIVVAFVAGSVLAFMQPREYKVAASVWADSQVPEDSTVGTTGGDSPPSAGQATLLGQLLVTRAFMRPVVESSPLANEYRSSDPLAAERMLGSIAGRVETSTPGPQLMTVTYTGDDPAVAIGMLDAIVAQYEQYQTDELVNRAKQQARYDRQQMSIARDVARAEGSRASREAYDEAALIYQTSMRKVEAAQQAGLRVVDQPEVAYPQARRKTLVFGAAGGLLAGLTISFFALVYLMARDKSLRGRLDAETTLGLDVVGEVPDISRDKSSRAGSPTSA